jgi:hypothetical protein
MRLRDIVQEDGDGGGGGGPAASTTSSSSIAGVAYPLFVKGTTRRQKRKNAKKAVGQKSYGGPSYIGKGVYETEGADEIELAINEIWGFGDKKQAPVKQTSVYRVLQNLATNSDGQAKDVKFDDGQIVSISPADAQKIVHAATLRNGAGGWEKQLGNWEVFKKVVMHAGVNLSKLRKATPGKHWTEESIGEANVVGHDSVIHKMDREDPMNKTEVLVLGGAGRYTLEGLRTKAIAEAQQLADDLKNAGTSALTFRNGAQNIKQLSNTLETIVSAYNQLERIRRKGGRGSRGITREHLEPVTFGVKILTEARNKVILK